MSMPQDVVVSDETAKLLDSIANYPGTDDDFRQLLELAGVDDETFRAFVSEIGKTVDPLVERILAGERAIQDVQTPAQSQRGLSR